MSDSNRIVWSEGLFLRPQHFQQQERYLEAYVQGRAAGLRTDGWGLLELEIERELLTIGKLGLRRARGVFPDGTPFAMPDTDPVPAPIDIAETIRDQIVHLALVTRKAGATLSARANGSSEVTRFRTTEHQARDVMSDLSTVADVEVATLNTRLMPQSQQTSEFVRMPVAHVIECRADGQVALEERFIPTVLTCSNAPRLAAFLSELEGLLHQRGEALAARAVASGRGGAAEIANFLLLQSINRYEPLITHLAARASCHPEDLYRVAVEIAGDLSTLTTRARRPAGFPGYRHEDLRASFEPVMEALRAALSVVLEQNAIPIPLEQRRFGISVGVVADRSLFDSAVFVLAARADMPAEELRRRFPRQLKLGPVEKIADLINLALPGIPIQPMPVAPWEIPFHAGFSYFELDRANDLWRALKSSGGIALHQAGDFPGLALEFWAIRS
jgi:type VI secretion system protein ImpJ